MTGSAAFGIIYYLQEVMQVIPDIYERCEGCDEIYDSEREGRSCEKGCFCDYCKPRPCQCCDECKSVYECDCCDCEEERND